MAAPPSHLDPSELGTKTYWEDTYKQELKNFRSNPEDQGTVWFSDVGAEGKVLEYLEQLAEDGMLFKERGHPRTTSFLDLGSGNGHMLFALRDAGWEGHMLGIDYSASSVALAQAISRRRVHDQYDEFVDAGFDEGFDMLPVSFATHDLFAPQPAPGMLAGGFDVVLDKGTFDAISLSDDVHEDGARLFEHYPAKVFPLLRNGGLLIITSCNWTEDELKAWFTCDKGSKQGQLVLKDKLKYQVFSFGGKTGQSVVTLCFEKRLNL